MGFIKYEYIKVNKYSRPGIKNYGIKGLIMHYTANNGGTARNHKTYFNNLNGIYASAHIFVDDDEAICIIPLDEVAYHANDTVKYNSNGTIYKPLYSQIGNANFGAIGLEMCLDKNGKITEKTFQNSVKAVKELVAKYPAIKRNTIWRHYDVTGKNCPAPWVSKPSELTRFKNAVFGSGSTSNSSNSTSFNINNYYTNKVKQIRLLRNDYAYKEAGLKNKAEAVKKGTVLTVTDLKYSGKYPRFKLKSGLFITTRKDYVEEVTSSSSSSSSSSLKGSNLPSKGTYTFTVTTNIRSSASTSASIVGTYGKGQSVVYDSKKTAGGYVWLSYIGGSGKRRYVAVV